MRISLDKQIYIYSVDTSAFYNDNEMKIHRRLNKNFLLKNHLKKIKKKSKSVNNEEKLNNHLRSTNKRINKIKDKLYLEFTMNDGIRRLDEKALRKKNIISVFDSVLTRTLGYAWDDITKDIIVVQTYFFDILEDIILNGFMYDDDKYICFTASAGQIRTKKTVFIKESVFLTHQNSLMCGLTIEKINKQGGVNINKYLAYLALCNSATDIWKDFDINKTIVVEDMETDVRSLVDFIDDKTYEITRKDMDIPITHTDGCGMILPRRSKKSMMVRLPWIKGLLVPFPFDKFIRESNQKNPNEKCGTVIDIYGKHWDILKDNIEIILTKSQFKMWKYYTSWDDYKDNYIKNNCHAGKCNEEESTFTNAKLNYQMLQTLSDLSDDELSILSKKSRNSIVNIGRDKATMLKVLGVTESNKAKNYFQQALEVYPELLNDTYSKEILKQVKKSMVTQSRAGKLDIDGKYTFICPDLYAFSEYLFLKNKNPNGLLTNGEVHCSLYKNDIKLDCLRSPHLYREHAIRNNIVDKEKGRWFITKGLYTSCHDAISKILMFDVDGDKSLVCASTTIINAAERNMNDVVPLYYNMAKAAAEEVDNHSIYNGLKTAYTGGNIGVISNDITKIWNGSDINLDVIKWLCMENNFTIDYAKTLYKVKRPLEKKKMITSYTKSKTPHFFIYAKDKKKDEVEKVNSSTVNRLEKLIPNTRINFKAANLGKFNYTMLMTDKKVEINSEIINTYTELDLKKRFMEISTLDEDSTGDHLYVYKDIRNQLIEVCKDLEYVVDVLIEYLYNHKKSNHKTTLWSSFGDVIVSNLKRNMAKQSIDEHIQCQSCGERIEVTSNRRKYCDECWKVKNREQVRERVNRHRNKNSM